MAYVTRTIAVGDRQIQIAGRADDPYFANLKLSDSAHDFLRRYIADGAGPEAVIFDVGANIGLTSVLFAQCAAAVYAFEPSKDAYPALQQTLRANNIRNCRTFPCALGAAQGRLRFCDDATSASASHLVDGGSLGSSTYEVDVTTLDAVVAREQLQRLDLIKIDVEGVEGDVLRGAAESLERFRPTVFVEFNSFTLIAYGNVNPRAFLEQLLHTFPHVYRHHADGLSEIRDPGSVLGFIHDNLVLRGCVDDLLCSFCPIR
jgi:FkbM family methyltransferase